MTKLMKAALMMAVFAVGSAFTLLLVDGVLTELQEGNNIVAASAGSMAFGIAAGAVFLMVAIWTEA